MRCIAAILVTVVLLFGCGGGGGGGGSRVPQQPSTRVPGDLSPPTFTDASIVPAFNEVVQRSDSLIVSDLFGKFRGETFEAPTRCSKTACTIDLGSGYTATTDVRDARDLGLDENLEYSGVGEKHGIRIAEARGRSTGLGFPADVLSYGAWLDHSAFDFDLYTIVSGTLGDVDLAGLQIGGAVSIGDDTGSRPTGNATYRGVMVGGTDVNGPPQALLGDATLLYDMGRNDLDVSFTNIKNLATGGDFQDMRWSQLPVDSAGSFDQETSVRDIKGRFYGPNHAEVGGVFVHKPAQAVGAFGAKR